jgi:hypothetical protein
MNQFVGINSCRACCQNGLTRLGSMAIMGKGKEKRRKVHEETAR